MAAALVALALAGPAGAGTTPGEVGVGQPLRDATLHGLNGPPRRLAQFRGKPLLINVWASWCGPCRQEMASLDRLAWLELAHGFSIIGISTDDYPEQALAWLKDSNATISQYIDAQLEMENMLGASHLPLTVLVGADGRVLGKYYGSRQWDSAESLALIRRTFRLPGPAAAAGGGAR
ncbi:MAG: TlpA family protein disulfide reductase [Proteobacteria bacterium]|nr:TlpA family protein disulfide reductase [Pseudomonadota bacterium]